MKIGRKLKKLVSAQGAEEGGLKTRQESSCENCRENLIKVNNIPGEYRTSHGIPPEHWT
jgi:hypothetical protein